LSHMLLETLTPHLIHVVTYRKLRIRYVPTDTNI